MSQTSATELQLELTFQLRAVHGDANVLRLSGGSARGEGGSDGGLGCDLIEPLLTFLTLIFLVSSFPNSTRRLSGS